MPVAILEIKHCRECPFLKMERHYGQDSWDIAYDWHCGKEGSKKIEGYVGWNEEDKVKIPDWCPLIKKKK